MTITTPTGSDASESRFSEVAGNTTDALRDGALSFARSTEDAPILRERSSTPLYEAILRRRSAEPEPQLPAAAHPYVIGVAQTGGLIERLREIDQSKTINGLKDHLAALRSAFVRLGMNEMSVETARRADQLAAESVIGGAIWSSTGSVPTDEEWRFHHDTQDGRHELIFVAWKKANPASKLTLRYVVQYKDEIDTNEPHVLGIRKIHTTPTIDTSMIMDEKNPKDLLEMNTLGLILESYYTRIEQQLYSAK